MTKLPYYFEVTYYAPTDEGTTIMKDGGFDYAESYALAAQNLTDIYDQDDIISIHIEMLEEYSFIFPIEQAQAIKKEMNL